MFLDILTSVYLGVVMLFSAIPSLPTYQYLKETIVQEVPDGVV